MGLIPTVGCVKPEAPGQRGERGASEREEKRNNGMLRSRESAGVMSGHTGGSGCPSYGPIRPQDTEVAANQRPR